MIKTEQIQQKNLLKAVERQELGSFASLFSTCLGFSTHHFWDEVFCLITKISGNSSVKWRMYQALFTQSSFLSGKSRDFLTPVLCEFSYIGHTDAVKFLLTSPQTHDYCEAAAGCARAIQSAVSGGHLPIVQFLIEKMPWHDHSNCKDPQFNLIAVADERERFDVLEYLIKKHDPDDMAPVDTLVGRSSFDVLEKVFPLLSFSQKKRAGDGLRGFLTQGNFIPNNLLHLKAFLDREDLLAVVATTERSAPKRRL